MESDEDNTSHSDIDEEIQQISHSVDKLTSENASLRSIISDLRTEIDNLKKRDKSISVDSNEKILAENASLRSSIAEMKTDLDKFKGMLSDKIPKAVMTELEFKINTHTKALDATAKKLFEVQNNVNAFVQQPVSHSLIESIRKQLTDEIMANTVALMDSRHEQICHLIDDKTSETRNLINNAKKFMFR